MSILVETLSSSTIICPDKLDVLNNLISLKLWAITFNVFQEGALTNAGKSEQKVTNRHSGTTAKARKFRICKISDTRSSKNESHQARFAHGQQIAKKINTIEKLVSILATVRRLKLPFCTN